jgi:protein required for attachment to host cells
MYKHETARRPTAWVLVADRARARIFESEWPLGNQLKEIAALVHPEGQAREQDVLTDEPGRFAELAAGPHSGERRTDHRHKTAIEFANVVAERLEKGRVGNQFGHLVLVAPALYLGVLRGTLSSPLAKLVSHEVTKDYTHLPAREILPLLQQETQSNGTA